MTESDAAQPPPAGQPWHLLTYPVAGTRGRSARWRQPAVDATLIVAAVAFGLFMLIPTVAMHNTPALVADIVLGAVACGALLVRRVRPAEVGVIAVVASVVSAFAAGASLVALFTAAIRVRPAIVLALTVGELAATCCFPLLYPGAADFSYLVQVTIGSLLNLAVVGWGLMVRAQRNYLGSVIDRARDLQARQEVLAANARDQERRRIAREMHDALAHRLSLLTVHAGALELRADLTPEQTRTMAGIIGETSRHALEDLQDVIGLLRDGSSQSTARLSPGPGVDDLPGLVAQARESGTDVQFVQRVTGPEAGSANPAAEAAVFRIVQEGLTNARKHAPHSPVSIIVEPHQPGEIMVTVSTVRDPRPAAGPAMPGTGTGLLGLAERAAVLGGTFTTDTAGEHFTITGRLPWPT